ncbi:group II intron reverse transcriptase/maturase [Ktedonobacter racemifer]|uniref:RNA-directed DNA polymerase (Reverse transcriptase) n=1 Tax=Ktedonobacter racemifer DSM 44963 TaxID=485913 RepID=D6TPQ0_KTERA|nr:group II intron reverse transcriptase/maturase [Ktedonobacter racemifer]EFH85664.1 RNA-directed DNA polymerase (Reverse transcriptase) [Ktedonobacter racemifer DSM 44963]
MQAQECLANGTEKQTDWNTIDWQKANRTVRNLRHRIFRATQEGNLKKVRSLQKLMLKSYSNRLMSVRRVAQINAGKHTPGVDKLVIKTPAARARMVDALAHYTLWQAKPARRVYIPKANNKLRPLGIPVVVDRCLQAMVKNALEPAWEARFEGSSYGFRPGRSSHDAIEKIYGLARPNKTKKWVLDADIRGAFDNISHEYLLKTLGPVPGKELIKQWLKAGYVEHGTFHATEQGTPQGGVVSPVLANIALHGMEEAIGVKYDYRGQLIGKRAVVRYADDFVCFCETKEDAEQVQKILVEWLKERGLTLSEEKTRIVHLTEGFSFLGFNIRHYPAPLTSRTGWKLLIKPSKESIHDVQKKLKDLWKKVQGTNIQVVLGKLNPVIRGWANYFRTAVAKEIFSSLDRWMFYKADRHTRRMHPKKSKDWRHQKYWGRFHLDRLDPWVFGDKQTGAYLLKFSWFPIERHVLVKGTSSPDDPRLADYWMKRQAAKAKDLTFSKQKLAKRQKGRCLECGESLFNDEELHVHHRLAKSQGGKDTYSNLVLVHLLCHQHIHAVTERTMRDCQKYNDQELLKDESATTQRSKQKEKKESCCS